MKRVKDRSDVTKLGNFDNGTCKRVLDLLEVGLFGVREFVIK